jgi:protein O-mannosyl-transferase
LLSATVVAAAVLAAFLPTLECGFAPLDDDVNFVHNLAYRGLGAQQLAWMFTTRHLGHYIPLSWMSCGLDYLLWGMNPFGYHLTNVLFHLLNSLLLLRLARLLLQKVWPRAEDSAAVASGALATALVFGVHPLRVESVAWITERRDVLSGFFVLLVLLLYVAAAEASVRRRRQLLGGSWVLYAAALLSKGITVVLPVTLVALDTTVLRPNRKDRVAGPVSEAAAGSGAAIHRSAGLWPAVKGKLPYFALAAAGAVATLWASQPVRVQEEGVGIARRLAAAAYGLTFYLRATVAPIDLPFFIPWPRDIALERPEFGLRAAAIVALAVVFLALRRRFPTGLVAFAVYVAWVLPVSGLLQAGPQLAAHRYTYLACLPWALLAGAGVTRLLGAGGTPIGARAAVAVAVAVVAATALLVVETRREAALWHDSLSFSRAAVASAPTDWLPRYVLARCEMQAGQWKEAAAQVRAGLRDTPESQQLLEMGALLFATSPDSSVRSGREALDLAERAATASDYEDAFALYALAAAQAEAGDFAGAESTARGALDEIDEPLETQLARSLAASVVLYEQKKPLRLRPVDWL